MMDSIKSFKGYGKMNEVEDRAFRQKTRRRIVILGVSAVVLVAVVIAAVVGTVIHKNKDGSNDSSHMTSAESIRAVCSSTEYPESCITSLSSMGMSNGTIDPEEIFRVSLIVAMHSLEKLSVLPEMMLNRTDVPAEVRAALEVCSFVFDDAIERLNESISSMEVGNGTEKILSTSKIEDIKTWLSSALTDQETCLDALEEVNSTLLIEMRSSMKNSTEYASNSLAIVSKILKILSEYDIPIHRKLLGESGHGFPEWVGAGDRRLLQESRPRPDVTVAKDESGNYKTITAALARVPKKSNARFVIYVKAGVYVENVEVTKDMWNVMFYGDGKNQTIVSGRLNVVDGTPTFRSATFATVGKGFIARDMGFINTAGPEKHQAVAFRSGADLSVFYRCSFSAYQDTLYPHSNRQFYRECDIIGTVDFIFGNAAVVLQNCNIYPRQPMRGQFVTITAQGKVDPNQNTGISIQRCAITPLDNLTAQTYLGRPWKPYSTTVVMQSNIGSFLNATGWIEWERGVEPPRTIFYAEYQNTGAGANLARRVRWAGYRGSITASQASRFTVQSFVQGSQWLPATNVVFDSSL